MGLLRRFYIVPHNSEVLFYVALMVSILGHQRADVLLDCLLVLVRLRVLYELRKETAHLRVVLLHDIEALLHFTRVTYELMDKL